MTAPGCGSDRRHAGDVPRAATGLAVIDHRLLGAAYRESPNHDARPQAEAPSLIVIHNISLPPDRYDAHPGHPNQSYIDDLFLNRLDATADPYFAGIAALRVSAHLCLFRDGRIVQYVPFDRRAWHAGVSVWQGRSRVNDFSIGIEVEGSDTRPFEAEQYRRLAAIIRALHAAYPSLPPDAITGHSDIAPGRKTDPGPHFDWPRLHALLEGAPQ